MATRTRPARTSGAVDPRDLLAQTQSQGSAPRPRIEFDITTIQETLKLVRMGDDPQEALAEVLCHTPQHMRPKVFQDPAGDKRRTEEEKLLLYAIEMMEEKKTTGTTATVVLVDFEIESQKRGIPVMLQVEKGVNDVELENEMPEKSGPGLPECQGGAG